MVDTRKSLKINTQHYDTLMEIKTIGNYKNITEVLEAVLPTGVITDTSLEKEPPAFEIKNHKISWTKLKNSKINTKWQSEDNTEIAILLYKDEYGALIRFQFEDDFYLNYFHFL